MKTVCGAEGGQNSTTEKTGGHRKRSLIRTRNRPETGSNAARGSQWQSASGGNVGIYEVFVSRKDFVLEGRSDGNVRLTDG